jgi:hypothetical protein
VTSTPLPEQFRLFAQGAARDGATTYDTICLGVAEDPEILALIGEAPLAQRRPNLLLAAVHFLLLGGTRHPLGGHYDTVRALDPSQPEAGPDANVVADFKDFCLTHRAELLALIAVRNTQTNEVGRCTALYTYRQRSDGATLDAGSGGSEVNLDCETRTPLEQLPPLALPLIAGRTGIDALPVDPRSDDGAHWLLACLWPDNLQRFKRLQGALAVAHDTADPPTVYQGDIIDDLPEVADRIEGDEPLIVFHSWVAAYLTRERQGELVEVVRAQSGRPVHHLYAEAPVETPGLPTPISPSPSPISNLTTALVHLGPDGAAPVRLADMHHHGKWLRWWATPPDPRAHRAAPAPAPRPR